MRPSLLFPVVLAAALFPGACAPQTAGRADRGTMSAEVIAQFEKRLAKRVNAEFVKAPLSEIIDFLQSVSEVGMVLDPVTDATGESLITVSAKEMPLGELLDRVLDQAGLRREYRDGAIYITAKESAEPAAGKSELKKETSS